MIRIGTSGWHYAHWRGCVYPPELPASAWLAEYARRFRCVEVNNSFYRLPSAASVAAWVAQTPPGFLFAVKASRYITHLKRLASSGEALGRLLTMAEGFGIKLGPILFQLPPHWHLSLARLRELLANLPRGHRYVFELRDPSWHCEEVYVALAEANAAFCAFELAGSSSPLALTADFAYVRLHGPGEAYCGSYSQSALGAWAERLAGWAADGRDVYLFFDNDQSGYAVANAASLQAMLADRAED